MGLVLQFSVAENMVLDSYYSDDFSSKVVMRWDDVASKAEQLVEQFDVRTPGIDVAAGNLSGGNQQKVIVAREFSRDLKLIIAAQPTRGLDVGSIEYIHAQMVRQRDQGAAVLVVSTELDEILALSDRIAVMFDGRVVAVLDRDETDATDLGLYMAGHKTADVTG